MSNVRAVTIETDEDSLPESLPSQVEYAPEDDNFEEERDAVVPQNVSNLAEIPPPSSDKNDNSNQAPPEIEANAPQAKPEREPNAPQAEPERNQIIIKCRVHPHLQVNSLHSIVQRYRGPCSTYDFFIETFFGFTGIIQDLLQRLKLGRPDQVFEVMSDDLE